MKAQHLKDQLKMIVKSNLLNISIADLKINPKSPYFLSFQANIFQ